MSKRTASLLKMNEKGNHSLATKRKLSGPGVKKSSPSPVHSILHLQRTKGNQEVQRLIKSGKIQAKLKIGKPNDKYEQEADRVADKVMTMPEPGIQRQPEEEKEEIQTKPLADQITPLVQRQADEEEEPVQTKRIQRQEAEEEEEPIQTKLQRQAENEEEEEPVQTKLVQRQANPEEEEETQTKLQRQPKDEEEEPIQKQPLEEGEEEKEPIQTKPAHSQTPTVTSNIESSVNSLKGGGQPLSESIRSYFESRFGSDFSAVRIHNDSQAAETAKSINAKAFTKGKDVVFGDGQYSPETSSGKRLLAHELTHVVQQNSQPNTSGSIQKQPSRRTSKAKYAGDYLLGFSFISYYSCLAAQTYEELMKAYARVNAIRRMGMPIPKNLQQIIKEKKRELIESGKNTNLYIRMLNSRKLRTALFTGKKLKIEYWRRWRVFNRVTSYRSGRLLRILVRSGGLVAIVKEFLRLIEKRMDTFQKYKKFWL